MYVTNLTGDEFMLQATSTNEGEVNGNQSISLDVKSNDVNDLFIKDLDKLWTVTDHDDVEHKIIYLKKQGEGLKRKVEIKGIPLFFDVLDNDRIYERYDTHMTAQVAFTHIFLDTGFTFVLVDSFLAVEWEGFGDGESKLESFKRAINRYKCEFKIVGNIVYLHTQIGRDTNIMYHHKLNASNIIEEVDASSMWTYARGYGDYEDSEDGGWEQAKLVREYTSPLAALLGVRHAPPIKDGRVKVASAMDQSLKTLVDESLKVSVSAGIHDLRKQGYPVAQSELGDRVFLIDDRIDLNDEVRVVSQSITRDWQGNVLDINIIFGSEGITKRHQSQMQTAIKNITELIEGNRKLPFSVLDNMVIAATNALKSAQTELLFENGLIAVDKNNPNYIVVFNSNGLGVSRDGGQTFRQAITYLGINTDLLTAGSIHTNNITLIGDKDHFFWDGNGLQAISKTDANKYVKMTSDGLYIARGALTIERPDGALWVADGIPTFDFGIQSADPPFTSPDIEIAGQWYTTSETSETTCQHYTFRHESRYLKFHIAHAMHWSSTTTSGRVSLIGLGDWSNRINVGKTFANTVSDGDIYHTFTVDLGVPTYEMGYFYLQLRTGSSSFPAQARKLRAWLEG